VSKRWPGSTGCAGGAPPSVAVTTSQRSARQLRRHALGELRLRDGADGAAMCSA
jgi:hypothetical protein